MTQDNTHNAVERPPHYTSGRYETIDVLRDIVEVNQLPGYPGYLLGNIVKYLYRFNRKNGVEDLRKARQYLDWLIGEMS